MFGRKRRKKKKGSGRGDGPSRIGRYTIKAVLGQGGMGTVYLGHDPVIGRNVAVKVITLRGGMTEEEARQYRERFLREAQAAGGLQHPNIVAVHDIGQDPEQGQPYIVMEYVPGEDLKKVIRAEAPLPPWKAIRIVIQIASALDYAHGRGIVHRDIKPANALIGEDGQVKIADFGVARLPDSDLTQTDQFVGSPGFISPEQLQGAAVDGRSDLFSLGVILYQLLTGRSPFEGDTPTEVLYRISNQPALPPTHVHGKLPSQFDPILDKALSKNPDHRYQTGRELMEALIALEAAGVVEPAPEEARRDDTASLSARVPGLRRRASPWITLNSPWRLATLLGALLVTFVGVNSGFYFLMRGPLGRLAAGAHAAERSEPVAPGAGGPGPIALIGGALTSFVAPPPPAATTGAMSGSERNGAARPASSASPPGNETTARLRVELDHQMPSGRLIVLVGGKTALSRPFDAPKGARSGSFSHVLSIPAGRQGVEVRVLGEAGEMRARSRIEGTLEPRRVAVLKIEQRNRTRKPLTLHWTSPEDASPTTGSR